jgi:hypothetical protein
MRTFLENHWGDLIGLLILYTGIFMLYTSLGNPLVSQNGAALILGAMVALKMRPTNGNPPPEVK